VKIFITGGTGFVGTSLSRSLIQNGYFVTTLTRPSSRQKRLPKEVSVVEGNSMEPGEWQHYLGDSDVVINLAGASIFQRWNSKNKQLIRTSRVLTTRNIVNAISLAKDKKIDLINASAVGYYGFHGDEIIDEDIPPGNDFLATVSLDWEAEALKAKASGARVVLCRLGVVLDREGGAMGKLLPLFRLGLGARLGTGKQWFSWIHRGDVLGIILYLLKDRDIEGPINCTSPNPVQNKEMTRLLSRALKRPAFMPPISGNILRLVLGEFAETLLKGQRVVPKVLNERGFPFIYPDFEDALHDMISA